MTKYELKPTDGHKSFYGKEIVVEENNGDQTLYSYGTPVIKRIASGKLIRIWNNWSVTTGRHIRSFCGLNKADFLKLPCCTVNNKMSADITPLQSYMVMMARRNIN